MGQPGYFPKAAPELGTNVRENAPETKTIPFAQFGGGSHMFQFPEHL